MERRGECSGCGWCCQFDGVQRNVVSPAHGEKLVNISDRRFYELRGGQSIDEGKTVRYLVHTFAPCSAHDVLGKTCKAYDDRPEICREFPSVPGQVEGTPCSHWFEEVVDGKTVKRGGGGSPYPTPPVFG